MAKYVHFTSKIGEIRKVKFGFSWTMFLFAGIFGIPLFYRGLILWGLFAILLLIFAGAVIETLPEYKQYLHGTGTVLSVTFGFHGNRLTAKHLLKKGWNWANPSDPVTIAAKAKWGFV